MKRLLIGFVVFIILLGIFVPVGLFADELETVPKIREDAEELMLEQSKAYWKTWVLGDPSNLAALYDNYPNLFTKISIEAVKTALEEENDKQQIKALTFLLHYMESEYLYKQTAQLWDIYNDLEANLKVLVGDKLIPYRELEVHISNAESPEKRAKLGKEEYRIYRLLNDVVLKRELQLSHKLVKDLGYKDYLELAVSYKMLDLESLLILCEKFLKETEPEYLVLFDAVSPIPRDQFRRSDILHVLGAKDWDEYFPQEPMIAALKNTLKPIGFDLDVQKNLKMHVEPLPKKNPRAVCFPMAVPEDVRISIKPKGGKDDYSALFHEMGHAQHFANTKTDIWEFQQLGSNAVTEGYAYLFEGLIEDSEWLKENTKLTGEKLKKFLDHARFSNLYMVRRYMSKLIYEVKLHRDEKDPQKLYQKLMSTGYGFDLTEEEALRYLSDVDPLLYAADYVQAFFIQAMLEETLIKKFGRKWWHNPKTGTFLKSLFAYGNQLSADELLKLLGYDKISDNALREKFFGKKSSF